MESLWREIFQTFAHWTPPCPLLWIIPIIFILAMIVINALILIWLERKISGRVQSRMGPMLNGPRFLANISMFLGGLMQTPCDAGKLLFKEDIIPYGVERPAFIIAPFLIMLTTVMAFIIIPFGPRLAVLDIDSGVVYLLAVGTFSVISILMAGWSSNNKYSLLGGLRSAAQIISYEVPMILAVLSIVMLAGSMRFTDIVNAQAKYGWFIIPGILAFIIYIAAALAEVNRPPFDIPEAEQELVQGYCTEYSGMRFAMFFLGEFCNALVVSAAATLFFLGGWLIPFVTIPPALKVGGMYLKYVDVFVGFIVFMIKTYMVILLLMWIRWTFPRPRPDQLMGFGWKVLVPLGLLNILWIGIYVLALQPAIMKLLGINT